MKKLLLTLLVLATLLPANAQWKPAGDKIKTQWAEKVNPEAPLPEYPRPIMVRQDWQNLNGLWSYAISKRGVRPAAVNEGKILVPFAIESSLSGVMKTVGKDNELWYERSFQVPASWKGRDVLLHFGAVDWRADVYINDVRIGRHLGGYAGFSFNITPYLQGGNEKLTVRVYDPTDYNYQAIGKQRTKPEGIWYTSVTGIWQTVWMEPVEKTHINQVQSIADIDNSSLTVKTCLENTKPGDVVEVTMSDGNTVVAQEKAAAGQDVELSVPNAKLWSTENPFLYNIKVKLLSDGKAVDEVESYAAMRKISKQRDGSGVYRFQLNNKDIFMYGPLDQGYWPDGLYTAPTDEALAFDIQKTKDFGFNMIRKHMKVEPARWFYWCDKLGMLVWQDMPSGDFSNGPQWQNRQYYTTAEGKVESRSAESKADYKREWKDIISQCKVYPCIVAWTPFNEAWGQFDTEEIVAYTKSLDPTRLVNTASGGNHFHTGDILDLHNYPGPMMYMFDFSRVTVLGEYGGLGLPIKGHLWKTDGNWGYVQFKNQKEVTDRYVELAAELKEMARLGFSGAVYTQTTDVEGEINGLMTYDRRVIKLDEKRVREANLAVENVVK